MHFELSYNVPWRLLSITNVTLHKKLRFPSWVVFGLGGFVAVSIGHDVSLIAWAWWSGDWSAIFRGIFALDLSKYAAGLVFGIVGFFASRYRDGIAAERDDATTAPRPDDQENH